MIDPKEKQIVAIENSELMQNLFLDFARSYAQKIGLTVTLEGRYSEDIYKRQELRRFTPFVIGQNEIEVARLDEGILEGLVIEAGLIAQLSQGIITPKSIEFKKVYTKSMSWYLIGFHQIPISYLGTSEDGVDYNGDWMVPQGSFKNVNESGKFQVIKLR
ncbi:MAG: hypothetical protein AABX11_05535 [Nanoarchaeota archaeon]